jgi:DNA-binding LacI/PurR family transcriptional regulator
MSQRMTLRDVAQYVGVSITTVSNAVRGWPYAADETRLKAQLPILELRYSPYPHISDRLQMLTVPVVTLARAGIDLLSLSRDETPEQSHIILEPSLIVCQSTAPPP